MATLKYLTPKLNPELGEKYYYALTDVINDYYHSIRTDKTKMISQDLINATRDYSMKHLKDFMDHAIQTLACER